MKKFVVLLIVVSTLTSCKLYTMYVPENIKGGYRSTQLNNNTFRVSFNGNGFISSETAIDLCLLRSAEITLENGFNYFIIINENNTTSQSSYTTPTRSYSNYNVTGRTSGLNVSGTTSYYGGNTYNISKPKSSNTIVLLNDKDEVDGVVFEALFLKESLRKQYAKLMRD